MAEKGTIEYILNQPEADLVVGNIVDRNRKGLYSLIMITGLPGTGKSSTCFRLKELAAEAFPNKKKFIAIIDNLADLARFAMKASEEDINIGVIEEVSTLFPSRRAMAGDNVDLARILDTCRKKRVILFANAPLWPTIDSHMRAMGTIYVETLKIYKKIGVVISKMFRLQTNPGSGKTYTHTMLRNGKEVKRMYTRRPNADDWKKYELQKDIFMNTLYEKITKRAEERDRKENKKLGIVQPIAKNVKATPKELEAYNYVVLQGMTRTDYAKQIGKSISLVSKRIKVFEQKAKIIDVKNSLNIQKGAVTGDKVTL